jgi:hypothetical protein
MVVHLWEAQYIFLLWLRLLAPADNLAILHTKGNWRVNLLLLKPSRLFVKRAPVRSSSKLVPWPQFVHPSTK